MWCMINKKIDKEIVLFVDSPKKKSFLRRTKCNNKRNYQRVMKSNSSNFLLLVLEK